MNLERIATTVAELDQCRQALTKLRTSAWESVSINIKGSTTGVMIPANQQLENTLKKWFEQRCEELERQLRIMVGMNMKKSDGGGK